MEYSSVFDCAQIGYSNKKPIQKPIAPSTELYPEKHKSLVERQELSDYCATFLDSTPFIKFLNKPFSRSVQFLSVGMFVIFHTTPAQEDAESISSACAEVISVNSGGSASHRSALEQLVPTEDQSEFTVCESGLNSGEKLASKLRILPDDHKVITSKLREKLDDARYHIYISVHFHTLNALSDSRK